jgi:hypothetical protein
MQSRFLTNIAMAISLAAAFPAMADPLADPQPLPAAKIPAHAGPNFSPSAATAGTADAGHQLSTIEAHLKNCSPLSPCAAPPPSLDHLGSPAGSRSN